MSDQLQYRMQMNRIMMLLCCTALFFFSQTALAQKEKEHATTGKESFFYNETPLHLYSILLSRPENNSVVLNIMANENLEGFIEYGTAKEKMNNKTPRYSFEKGKPQFIQLTSLQPDTRYYYRFVFTQQEMNKAETSGVSCFHTQRAFGKPFTFTIQADSHLDENSSPAMYIQTLNNIARDSADFLIDLGDTWMTDKFRTDYKESLKQYIAQHYFFGIACHSLPLFLTIGNHDGETGKQNGKQGNSITAWATAVRKQYYCNPQSDAFFSGNINGDENYYAWEWGNALFIVLDPFRYTTDSRNPWLRTLGEAQYIWLKSTLQNSRAAVKFVFIHNLVGGQDIKGVARGGAEASFFFEWGGLNADSSKGFSINRPGWEKPIHDLLVQFKVNVVFHGHDHVFVKQEREGVVYQTLPQPGSMRYGNTNIAEEYGYKTGVMKSAPGYLRVSVTGSSATVEYIQTSIDAKNKNKEVLYSYTVPLK